MSQEPANSYAQITAAVANLIARHSGNDLQRAAYMVARSAILIIRTTRGPAAAAEQAYRLGDEMTGE